MKRNAYGVNMALWLEITCEDPTSLPLLLFFFPATSLMEKKNSGIWNNNSMDHSIMILEVTVFFLGNNRIEMKVMFLEHSICNGKKSLMQKTIFSLTTQGLKWHVCEHVFVDCFGVHRGNTWRHSTGSISLGNHFDWGYMDLLCNEIHGLLTCMSLTHNKKPMIKFTQL